MQVMQAAYIDLGARRQAGIESGHQKKKGCEENGLLTALLAFVVGSQATVTLDGGGVFRK
jgi:hypothetical protein